MSLAVKQALQCVTAVKIFGDCRPKHIWACKTGWNWRSVNECLLLISKDNTNYHCYLKHLSLDSRSGTNADPYTNYRSCHAPTHYHQNVVFTSTTALLPTASLLQSANRLWVDVTIFSNMVRSISTSENQCKLRPNIALLRNPFLEIKSSTQSSRNDPEHQWNQVDDANPRREVS